MSKNNNCNIYHSSLNIAAADLQISENSFVVKYFDMVNAKLHLVWGHFQHRNLAMPFLFHCNFESLVVLFLNYKVHELCP